MTTQRKISHAAKNVKRSGSLRELLGNLRVLELVIDEERATDEFEPDHEQVMAAHGIDICELPKFGGEQPKNTNEVWSWDKDNLLVGTGPFAEWRIIERPYDYAADDLAFDAAREDRMFGRGR